MAAKQPPKHVKVLAILRLRCIEMGEKTNAAMVKPAINYNMRCIEIYKAVYGFINSDNDKLQHEIYLIILNRKSM